ncbi:MAG: radical SAM protein [Candidatus Woesearchaeota archaeon]
MKAVIRKSLLYRSKVEYADFCINHVEGCSNGCRFPCYAMMMAKRFGRIQDYDDWRKPKIVSNALQLLDREIPKYRKDIKSVHLCFMTDPFMYQQREVQELSLQIIKKLNDNRIKCTVLTKGVYPNMKSDFLNEYGVTLVSLNENFRKAFEPRTAPYKERIQGLRRLHNQGHKTWVSIEPYPTPNLDTSQNLKKLLETVSFVDKIIFGKLNYNVKSTNFLDSADFYEDCANQVIDFCSKKGIDCHIKFGTQKLQQNIKQSVPIENNMSTLNLIPC